MSQYDRDLAEAIYAEIIAAHSVAEAKLTWAEHKDMRYLLAHIATWAIDAVLARRLREAARTGPWDETVEMVEPLTGDIKILDKRTGRIVGTRRGDYDEEDGYPWVMLPRKRTP
jgi:hypothetical protein